MPELINFFSWLVGLYSIVVLVAVVMSFLFASGRVNRYDPRLRGLMEGLDAVTQPVFRRVRPWLPDTRPLDLAPLAVGVICVFIQMVIISWLHQAFG